MNRIVQIKTPGTIIFGVGSCSELPQRARALSDGPFLIVTDQGLVGAGIIEEIKKPMSEAGLKVSVFDAVEPDPEVEIVDKCLEAIKSTDAKAVIGIGGGSSLDIAKTAAAMACNAGGIMDYAGIDKLPSKGLPLVLLPTTSGTGSEVTPIAVLSDKKQQLKIGVVSPHLYADTAIVDPALTVSCPAKITAASGMDALTHAIEVYINKFSVPIIDTFVLEAIRLVGRHLRKCVGDGSDITAREGMSLASLYGGLGLGPVNTAAVHALAYPVGGMFNVAHGLANSVLLPYVMKFNQPACESKFARIAEALGAKGESAVETVVKLSKDVGIPQRLRDIGIPEEAIPEMAISAMKVTRLLNNNPRELTLKDAEKIYRNGW